MYIHIRSPGIKRNRIRNGKDLEKRRKGKGQFGSSRSSTLASPGALDAMAHLAAQLPH
jgi:hypothetical protein